MQGYKLEWIPGFDHAGIATHIVALRKLQSEGTILDADDLQNGIRKIALENLDNIKEQLQSLGAILDWKSQYYTLDEVSLD